MLTQKRRRSGLAAIFALCLAGTAHADNVREAFIRTGAVTGQFQGQDIKNGVYNTDVSIEGEIWLYKSMDQAWTGRLLMANESGIGRSRYFGADIGQRYFVFNDGLITDKKSGDEFISIRPNLGYYIGWDAGLAQFLVVPYSDILASYSTMIALGGTVGVKKMISSEMSVDVTASYTFGYSVTSSLSLTTSMLRLLVGLGFTF